MKAVGAILMQVFVSVLVTGLVLPLVVAGVPAVRSASVGPFVGIGIAVASFVLLRMIWPRQKV